MVEMLKQTVVPPLAAVPALPIRPGVVYLRTLQDNLVGIMAWGIGYSVLIAVVVTLYPILQENNTLLSVLHGLGLLEAVSRNYAVDVAALATFPGYLALEALGWAPTILSVYLIPQAVGAMLGEEKRGTLDLLLSTPISRVRLMTEKILAIFTSLALILLLMWLAVMVSTQLVADAELSAMQAAAGVWHILPICAVITAVTLLLSSVLPEPRTAASMAALFVFISFFVRSLADLTQSPALVMLRRFSVYGYYSSLGSMVEGVRWNNDIGLLAIAILCCAAALFFFQRRDLYL